MTLFEHNFNKNFNSEAVVMLACRFPFQLVYLFMGNIHRMKEILNENDNFK